MESEVRDLFSICGPILTCTVPSINTDEDPSVATERWQILIGPRKHVFQSLDQGPKNRNKQKNDLLNFAFNFKKK